MSRSSLLVASVLLAIFAASPALIYTFSIHESGFFTGVHAAFFGGQEEEIVYDDKFHFVGDIMLARHVETLMKEHDASYPYQMMKLDKDAVWIGNFEATVPNDHIQTKDFAMNFSVDKQYLQALKDFGFEYLSLANNHSYDFGSEVFIETRRNLRQFELFGHPNEVTDHSYQYIDFNDLTLSMIAINATDPQFDSSESIQLIKNLHAQSDIQIVYIHWGDEYKQHHNEFQEKLATQFIDAGADIIIGHHPHVVQDVQIIKGKPVFYSLGNFIFDQYFDTSVQEGLLLSMTREGEDIVIGLIPLTMTTQKASPQIMDKEQAKKFMVDLAERSDPDFYLDILNRELRLDL